MTNTIRFKRNENIGPYDSSEVDESVLNELLLPARDVAQPKHLRKDESRVRVWTHSCAFWLPQNASIMEEYSIERDENGNETDSMIADALHVLVPGTDEYPSFTVVISIFAAAISESDAWNSQMWRHSYESLEGPGVTRLLRKGSWGITITGRAEFQEVYVIGASGPRWVARITSYGFVMNQPARDIVRDIMSSLIVRRGDKAVAPGEPLDVSLIDRRSGHELHAH